MRRTLLSTPCVDARVASLKLRVYLNSSLWRRPPTTLTSQDLAKLEHDLGQLARLLIGLFPSLSWVVVV